MLLLWWRLVLILLLVHHNGRNHFRRSVCLDWSPTFPPAIIHYRALVLHLVPRYYLLRPRSLLLPRLICCSRLLSLNVLNSSLIVIIIILLVLLERYLLSPWPALLIYKHRWGYLLTAWWSWTILTAIPSAHESLRLVLHHQLLICDHLRHLLNMMLLYFIIWTPPSQQIWLVLLLLISLYKQLFGM